jgi:Skp family chaperone for outer membrane proteins
MKIYTVDFESIIKVYKPYIDAAMELENEKNDHISKMEGYKSEMQTIINSSQTLILDENMKKEKMERFGKLQNEASKLDNEFRIKLSKMQDEMMKKIYSQIEEIISEFSIKSSIDMIINKTEVIYSSANVDLTSTVIDIVKEKGLYTDELINKKESV